MSGGWKLVPVEITPEIGHALESNIAKCNPPSEVHAANWRDAWKQALAASPAPPPDDRAQQTGNDIASEFDARLSRWPKRDALAGLADTIAAALTSAIEAAKAKEREAIFKAAFAAQPSTAENPNEDSYQRGRFDGVIEYGRALSLLKAEIERGR